MKTILPFVFSSFLLSTTLLAQVTPETGSQPPSADKGTWQLGLRGGRQGGELIGNRTTLQLQASYLVFSQLALGVSGTWAREGQGGVAFQDLTVGPQIRFRFTTTRFYPFVDLSYQVGKRMWNADITAMMASPNSGLRYGQFNPGVSYGVTKALRLEATYGFQWLTYNLQTNYVGQVMLGASYAFLGRK